MKSVNSAASLAANLFNRHTGELQRFLIRRVNHAADADDLSQEVFARLLRVRDVELMREPLAYLLGIATHVVREFHQRKHHDRVLFDSEVAEHLYDGPQASVVNDDAEQLDLRRRLDGALAQLSPTHQLVVLLVKRDGMSYTEAAAASGLSVHTIEKYLVEARARLRVLLMET